MKLGSYISRSAAVATAHLSKHQIFRSLTRRHRQPLAALLRRHALPPESPSPAAPRCHSSHRRRILLLSPSSLSPPLHLRLRLRLCFRVPNPFCIEEYLVASCGLSHAQALKASKRLPHLKSASNPDVVLALLSSVGLSRPDIAAIVAADPLFLRARADNIARRLASLHDRVGLSDPQIARFLLAGGALSLRSCDVAPRLEFWIPFLGSFDKLLQTVRKNNRILTADLEKVAKPNIALLGECGLSVCDMVKMSQPAPRLVVCNPERVKAFVLRADKLGVPRTSSAFKYAVGVACCVTEDKVTTRLEFFRSTLGCSMEMICAAVCTVPNILGLSEERLRCKIEFLRSTLGCSMDRLSVAVCKSAQILGLSEEKLRRKIEFMVTEVGLEPEYIVERPALLTFSMEKRMVPRHYVVKILQAKGLMKKGASFLQILCYGDKVFIVKYIDRHKDAVPGLADAYTAVCARIVPAEIQL